MSDFPRRVVFVEEYGEEQYVQVIASGAITAETLGALTSFIEHQMRRLETPEPTAPSEARS